MRHQRRNTDGKTLESRRHEEHTTGVGPAASRCLSEDEVMRLCDGAIPEEHLPRIDEHLDRCEPCQRWVAEVMAQGETNPADEDASLHPAAFRAGTVAAGRFRIARFIKRGGMGEVYEAFDSVLETRVALKTIISTACDSPRAVRKLKAEVQLARSIRHPNVCSVFDIWEHHAVDGAPVYFFTMEFIDGLSLGQLLERSLFDFGETLRIARLELLGLRAAHDSGVVHRDFKSDNVMLRKDRQDDSQVVVMDFGLARTLQKEGAASNDSEQFAGSVAYMAPEQVEGRRHIGPEADVFAFGVVLFEMLTGQLPWVGDSPWTTAALRLTQRAPPPSRLRPGLSPRVDAFVLKCLSREPTDRFKDAREALAAFDGLLGPPPRRRRRWVVATSAAFVIVVLALALRQRTSSEVSALQPADAAASAVPSPPAARHEGTAAPIPAETAAAVPTPAPLPGAESSPPQGPTPTSVAPLTEPEKPAGAAAEAMTPERTRLDRATPEHSASSTNPTKAKRPRRSERPDPEPLAREPGNTAPASAAPASTAPPTPRAFEPTGADAPPVAKETAAGRAEHAPGAPVKLRDFE